MARVLIARICRGHWERCELGSWLAHAFLAAARDPRVTYINDVVVDKCPTDAAHNEAVLLAQKLAIDVLFTVDHDNVPDPAFFTFGVDYLLRHPAAVVASPYCGARPCQPGYPDREVQVVVKDAAAPEGRRRVTRAEAATLSGVRPAYGVGTVLAIGMKVFDLITPPWHFYRYFDELHTQAGTEDFAFSEKVVDAGGEVVVNWDVWTGHAKQEVIGRPGEGGA
jgi:hypothetical protein